MTQLKWLSNPVPNLLKAGVLALALGLAACGGEEGGTTTTSDRDFGNFGQESDIVLGDMDAPISIIEYASVTCGHCAAFHIQTYPFLKEEYIDAGLVRYTMRELPTPPTTMARLGFMVARCVDETRYYNFIDALMRSQQYWAFNPDPNARMYYLAQLSAQAGLSEAEFNACRQDQAMLDMINARAEAGNEMGVVSTPTFFINGEMFNGAVAWEQFEELLIPHLPEELRPSDEAGEAQEPAESE